MKTEKPENQRIEQPPTQTEELADLSVTDEQAEQAIRAGISGRVTSVPVDPSDPLIR